VVFLSSLLIIVVFVTDIMKPFSAKNKIILALAGWIITCAGMLMYGFDILQGGNQQLIFQIEESKKELAALQDEKDSFVQAQKDVEQMKSEKIQPEDFFSKDITLVNELKTLEGLGDSLGVELSVSGISGTAKTAGKAKTISDIATVPYSIYANGPYRNIVDLVQTLENLPFVSTINAISLSVGDQGSVNLSLGASLYLRRN
jgi:hypothetical protein